MQEVAKSGNNLLGLLHAQEIGKEVALECLGQSRKAGGGVAELIVFCKSLRQFCAKLNPEAKSRKGMGQSPWSNA